MMLVLVTGPAGVLGSAVIARLLDRGHLVRALVRRTALDWPSPVQVVRGDVRSAEGVARACAGVSAVICAATSPLRAARATEVDGARNVVRASAAAGTHVIYPSIVGIDSIGGPYYRAKLAAEHLVAAGPSWTIQRATQFHPLVNRMLSYRVFPATSRLSFQPVDAGDLASRLVDLAEAGPAGRAGDFGGPQVLTVRDLAAVRRSVTGRRTALIPVPAAGPLRALDAGRNLCPDHALGKVTWREWLEENRARGAKRA